MTMIACAHWISTGESNGQEGFGRPALGHDWPHRQKDGNTRVATLRKTYGEHFAKGRRKDMMLKTLLAETGTDSLHAYLPKYHK
jgi:hypothetical protein